MENVIYKILRFDGQKSYMQQYTIPYEAGKTLLWGLLKIKEEQDATLTFTASCRSAVCGSCAVRVNGQAMLACSSSLDEQLQRYDTDNLLIEPIRNFTVIRDLVVDWQPQAARLQEVKPWLIPDAKFSALTGCRQRPEDFKKISSRTGCILCGACASECNKLGAGSSDFYEPFIYSKVSKFAADSRDTAGTDHLIPVLRKGLWKCFHCGECVTHCPKKLSPMEDIADLRSKSMAGGVADSPGAKHAKAFCQDIYYIGRLNEPLLSLRTEGMVKTMKRLPFALRLLGRGKLNPLHFARLPVRGIVQVRKIIKTAKGAKK